MHALVRSASHRLARAVAVATIASTTVAVLPASASAVPAPAAAPATATADAARPHTTVYTRFLDQVSDAAPAAERRVQRQARRAAARQAAEAAAAAARTRADTIMDLAAREAGDPYVWGAAGPSAFDCSGYTMYVFAQVGISLPHSSAAQASMARPVSDPQVGDLVFFGGSNVYHVAIYAGDGYIWHAPRPGLGVRKDRIWTSVSYGRVD